MKRLVLAATLALGLHALVLSAKVEWTKGGAFSPAPPIRLSLSYKTPESQDVPHLLPLVETPATPPDPPALEKPKEPEKAPIAEHKKPLPKKKPAQKAQEQKAVPEIRDEIRAPEPRSLSLESTEEAPGAKIFEPTPPVPAKEMASGTGIPDPVLPLPGPGADRTQAPLRRAVPLYLKNPAPHYPPGARRRGYEGTVMMEVLVDRQGKVREMRLFESSGYDILDRAAMRAVKGWVFEPARQGEEVVEMWVKVPLTFRLKD